MTPHDYRLPDILRPTELNDFGDLFTGSNRRPKKFAAALAAVVMLFFATRAITPHSDRGAEPHDNALTAQIQMTGLDSNDAPVSHITSD